MHILYIEDNPVDASVTAASIMLALPRSTVDLAYSLAEAQRRLADLDRYDLVLLDLELPDGPGLTLLDQIRDRNRTLPVVILSGTDTHAETHAAFRAGADHYIVKHHHYLRELPALLQSYAAAPVRAANRPRPQPLDVLYLDGDASAFGPLRDGLARLAPHIRLAYGSDLTALHDRDSAPTADILLVAYDGFGRALDELAAHRGAATRPVVLLTLAADAALVVRTRSLAVAEYLHRHSHYLSQLPMTLEAVQQRAASREQESALRQTVTRLHHLLDSNPSILYSGAPTAESWHLTWVSNNILEILGFSREEALAPQWWLRQVHPDDRDEAMAARERLRQHDAWDFRYRLRCADGRLRTIRDQTRVIRGPGGEIAEIVGSWNDETDRHEREEQMAVLARCDVLTGLGNRWAFEERLTAALATAASATVGVVLLDLVGLQAINASFGMAAGDDVLQRIACRIADWLPATGYAARMSGDEFALLLTSIDDGGALQALGMALGEELAAPLQLGDIELRIQIRAGISLTQDPGSAAGRLIQQADSALNHAKGLGKGAVALYEEHLTETIRVHTRLACRLRQAIERNQLQAWYQPKVDLTTGRIIGVEALARWHDEELGAVPPDRFIPIAETYGLIDALGMQILRTACEQVRAWEEAGLGRLHLAVNLSPLQLDHPHLRERLDSVLAATGLAPDRLELELTESALLHDVDGVVELLTALRQRGIRIALDDFGKGYSSLGYLSRFPIDTLKIDKRFVAGLPDNPGDSAIAAAIVQLGRSLGYDVLAEGVEHDAQLQALKQLGCGAYQGFLFSRPLPGPAMAELLATLGARDCSALFS